MRNGIVLIGISFAVALAYVVGSRLSSEALAVVVGAVCGISASIPVSIGLVIAMSKNWGRSPIFQDKQEIYRAPSPYTSQPPLVIFSPPQTPTPIGFTQNPYSIPSFSVNPTLELREFKIIGGDE